MAEKLQARSEVGKNIRKLFPEIFKSEVSKTYNSKNLKHAKSENLKNVTAPMGGTGPVGRPAGAVSP